MEVQRTLVEIVSADPFDDEPVKDTPLFSIDGEVYGIQQEIPASVALRALDVARRQGEEIMMSWVLEEVLGQKAYQALLDCRTVTPGQLKSIMNVVVDQVMGSLEESRGN